MSNIGSVGSGLHRGHAFILLVLTSLAVGFGFATTYLPLRFFDSADWKSSEYWSGERVQMIDHLVWSGKLDGLSPTEVIELLGPETETTYFSDYDLVYVLGSERGLLSIDSEWLVIDFDGDGVVKSYEVVAD